MADEKTQQSQAYDSTLKEWILQQPQEIIAVLLPGAIYQETVNVEVIRPTIRADKVFKVFYEGDEIALSQQLIWMEIFLERTDTVPQQEKNKIQEKLNMYDQLWEENSKIKRIRAESRAEGEAKGLAEGEAKGLAEGEAKGKVEALQAALVTTVELRFPALSELAARQVKQINKPDMLTLLFRQITIASDEEIVRQVLNLSAA